MGLLSVAVVHDEEDEPLYFVSQIQDVTERKRSEEALERLSQRHEMVLKSAGEGIFGLDLHGKVTFVNPAASEMTGWSTQDVLGRPLHNLLPHTKPDDAPYPREQCPIYAASRPGPPIEGTTKCSGGRTAQASRSSIRVTPSSRMGR